MTRSEINFTAPGIITILLIIFVFIAGTSINEKSATVDEVGYITSGYYMLKTGDLTFNMANPIFLQMLVSLPLVTMDLELPEHNIPFFHGAKLSILSSWKYAMNFFYQSNRENVEQILFRARLITISLSLVLAIYVFFWSRELYGVRAGIFALFLFVFSPNILAHSRLATTDIGFASFALIAFYYYHKLIIRPNSGGAILAGIFLGLAIISKAIGIWLILIFFFYLPITLKKEILGWSFIESGFRIKWMGRVTSFLFSFLTVLIVALFVVNLGYGFKGTFEPLCENVDWFECESLSISEMSLRGIIKALPAPLPASLIRALEHKARHSAMGHPAFLMGHYSTEGWWYYFFIAFMLKVPLPILILFVASIVYILAKKTTSMILISESMLAIPVLSLFLLVSSARMNVGFRHVILILPFIFIFSSKLMSCSLLKKKWGIFALAMICVWYIFSSISIFPHYLAYFNELAGGPGNGYKYLVDSNIDWGQDLKGLEKYMTDNKIAKVKLSYFGSGDPSYYGIDYEYLPSVGIGPSMPDGKWWYEDGYQEDCGPTDGIIAVSVTNLQGALFRNHDCFHWLRNYKPIAKIGYSIFVYDIPSQIDTLRSRYERR